MFYRVIGLWGECIINRNLLKWSRTCQFPPIIVIKWRETCKNISIYISQWRKPHSLVEA
jgi:hypothetical protein